jgi:hypothetical protein
MSDRQPFQQTPRHPAPFPQSKALFGNPTVTQTGNPSIFQSPFQRFGADPYTAPQQTTVQPLVKQSGPQTAQLPGTPPNRPASPSQAVPRQQPVATESAPPSSEAPAGLWSQLKERFMGALFEDAPQRPIGISQINRKTFQAAEPEKPGVFFRNDRPYQDYRFIKLVDKD